MAVTKGNFDKKPVSTVGWMIADQYGWVQLHTLRSSPSKAWQALWNRELLKDERKQLRKQGFHAERVVVKSF